MIGLLLAHWIGDFVCQTDRMALNKSKDWLWLLYHVAVYSTVMFLWALYFSHDPWFALKFLNATFALHFITDAVTSRITSALWFVKPLGAFYNVGQQRYEIYAPIGGNRHYFFVMIGLDQVIHYVTLLWTIALFTS